MIRMIAPLRARSTAAWMFRKWQRRSWRSRLAFCFGWPRNERLMRFAESFLQTISTWSAVLRYCGTAPTRPSGKNACRSGWAEAAGAARASSTTAVSVALMLSATNARVKTCASMSWEWAAEIRERHFGPPLPGGYRLERVDEDTYWDRHEAELRQHFGNEALLYRDDLLAPARRTGRERVVASEGADQIADYWLVHAADGSLAGVFSCRQRSGDEFELYHV